MKTTNNIQVYSLQVCAADNLVWYFFSCINVYENRMIKILQELSLFREQSVWFTF